MSGWKFGQLVSRLDQEELNQPLTKPGRLTAESQILYDICFEDGHANLGEILVFDENVVNFSV